MALSIRLPPDRQCWGKRQLPNKAEAKRAIKNMERLAGRMVAYRCEHCGAWHVGHQPRRRR